VHPIGADTTRSVDVRFVCATHRDLEQMVARGSFREDLYYRIRVVEIVVPPLRDRGHSDLDRLIDHFLFQFRRRHGRMGVRLAPGARARLHSHHWPGNVRELQNQLESALILAPSSTIRPEDLRLGLVDTAPADTDTFRAPLQPLDTVERAYVRWALQQLDGNRSATARALQIGRNTLLRKLREDGD
jgi:Nif-specific regulatory protein